ncbi:hypothetical protein GYMLUDRAFT_612140 [Collybiopsis luxurians FD-317 M1]|uniref:Unplaced genomic scaffold GYMLUscaffold_28, whole genome shotgun sequence n=1 Tax=Collybiopsis luxurians FD-317 M1 TaxID=944289 RepID=A0A0D0BWU5_9AGAR|nr:hypothetical protein GYMLUDRAFT_612140 [Collybiopsis luxurians FD-317 M1]
MTEHPSTHAILARSAISTAFAIARPITNDFESLWAKALVSYKEQTGRSLYQDQVAQFPDDPSVDNIVSILETQSKGLEAFREKGRNIRNVLKPVVNLVTLFNDTGAEAAAAASVPGGKAIFVAFGALLAAAKGVTEVYDALEEISEKLQDALDRIKWHLDTNSKLSSRMKEIYTQMLVEVLHVFVFLIKYPKSLAKRTQNIIWRRSKDFGNSLLGEKEVQEALQRLDKLTNRESLMKIAEIHNKVYDIGTKVDNIETKIVVMQMDEQSKKWLSPPDVYQHHYTIYKEQHKGTGAWLFKPNSKFSQWKQGKSSFLWIYGKPGSGKSVLCV